MTMTYERPEASYTTPQEEAQARLESVIQSPELESLTREFGADGFDGQAVPERIASFKVFANANWDFRGGKERWEAEPFNPSEHQSERIFDVARHFGNYNLVDSTEPQHDDYEFVTILGAGNDGPLYRVRYAKEQIEKLAEKPKYMILLGSAREVTSAERAKTDTFAPGAVTEFDLMNAAVEREYGVSVNDENTIELRNFDVRIHSEDDKRFWKVRRYVAADGMEILSVCAPQIDGIRRANTGDTYRFMREVVGKELLEGKRVLNVTHAVYTAFQDMDARRELALPTGAEIDTIGFEAGYSGVVRKPDALLQEMNSAANSAQLLQTAILETLDGNE